MAYSSWNNQGWSLLHTEKRSSDGVVAYRIYVEWGYRQDTDNLKTEIRTTRIKLVSYNGWYVQSSGNTTAGIGVDADSLTEKSGLNTVMASTGKEVVQDLTDVSKEVLHDDDGMLSTKCYIYGKYFVNVSSSSVPNLPSNEWHSKEITSLIPTIKVTNAPSQAKIHIKLNEEWKRGNLHIKQNGAWAKAKKIFIKQNGAWVLKK